MLTQLDFTRNHYVSSVFFCTMAFMLLNAPAFAVDTTDDGAMTVLSMEEMESLAGGNHIRALIGRSTKKPVRAFGRAQVKVKENIVPVVVRDLRSRNLVARTTTVRLSGKGSPVNAIGFYSVP